MRDRVINVGVIGCGRRMQYLLPMLLARTDRIRVAALCDPLAESIAQARQLFNGARVHDNYRKLVRDPEVDWVAVGSWNCFHREHILAALEAGKHVFTEKPLATTLDDCVAIKNAWRKQKRKRLLFVGFTLRYSPHYHAIRRLLDSGKIGNLISLEFNETLDFNHGGHIFKNWRRLRKNSGGHLLEKCCHDIDLMNWFVGSRARSVASFGGNNFFVPANKRHMKRLGKDQRRRTAYLAVDTAYYEDPFTGRHDVIDNQVAIIEYRNGVRATFHTNCNSAIPERRMYLLGTEGAIRADVLTGKIELARIGFGEKVHDASSGASGGHGDGDQHLVGELTEAMLRNSPPLASVQEGLESAVTCFGIDQAMQHRRVVNMAPLWRKVGLR